jgi:hypothetical protein
MTQPIFIGFKADMRLREKLDGLTDTEKKYVGPGRSAFLQICMVGDDRYVGRLLDSRLTTDQVEDISRNILSIVRKIGHEGTLPKNLQIVACRTERSDAVPEEARPLE